MIFSHSIIFSYS